MVLHRDPKRAERLRKWGHMLGFSVDLGAGDPQDQGKGHFTADWRNHVLLAFEAGRKAGTGIGQLGAILVDIAPDTVPREVHLRGLLACALTERPKINWRRPSGARVVRMAESERTGSPVPVFELGRQRMDHRPRIVIGLGTSSSIDAQTLRLFTAEAEAIARCTGAEAHLLAFDEAVFAGVRLDPMGWHGLRDLALRTGGGTDFHGLFKAAAKIQPSVLVILTDLDAPLPAKPTFPVLWAVPDDGTDPPKSRVPNRLIRNYLCEFSRL